MDLLNAPDLSGEMTQRLTLPTMPAYGHLVPPTIQVVTEPAAELERIVRTGDVAAFDYRGRHRRSPLASLLRRIGVTR